ncbi:hypothetical protein CSQ89_18480 [Chitinimonas sp. BJB300]|nr:hypothetical protein CSQ89_18480 [Chitinimonas sp. BJB300]TSJ83024.1 hypothetical protein FG002_021785 [Chitinimonas sp. BJB300]
MRKQTTDSATQPDNKQGRNPVDTGLMTLEVIDLLDRIAASWDKADQLPVQVFRALLKLHHQDSTTDSFTAMDIAEAMDEVRGYVWIQDKTYINEVSRKVRDNWKKLEAIWKQKKTGVLEQLIDKGIAGTILLDKKESIGGAGRLSTYAIRLEITAQESEFPAIEPIALAEGEIHYFTEDLLDEGWLITLLSAGFEMIGWKRSIFRGVICVPFFVFFFYLIFLLAQLSVTQFWVDWRSIFLTCILIAWSCYAAKSVIDLLELRVVLAPFWIFQSENDVVLEWRTPPNHKIKHIQAVRYKAQCLVCDGRVRVRKGGIRFWGRLIGACEASPREHVYSFDHVTKRGKEL